MGCRGRQCWNGARASRNISAQSRERQEGGWGRGAGCEAVPQMHKVGREPLCCKVACRRPRPLFRRRTTELVVCLFLGLGGHHPSCLEMHRFASRFRLSFFSLSPALPQARPLPFLPRPITHLLCNRQVLHVVLDRLGKVPQRPIRDAEVRVRRALPRPVTHLLCNR